MSSKKKETKKMAKQQVKQSHDISNEAFIKAWQSSGTYADVLKELGVTAQYASSRATVLRRKKVELKSFKRGRDPIDVQALNVLAKKYLKE
jgi:hypothetical protein